MRLSEDHPLDPDVLAELEAIDATLRGEPVDPEYAELAELALLLADQREPMPAESARLLDAAVGRRFAPAPGTVGTSLSVDADAEGPRSPSRRPRLTRWALRPSFGAALAGMAAVAVAGVIVLNNNSAPSAYSPLRAALPRTSARNTTASAGGVSSPATSGSHTPTGTAAPLSSPPSAHAKSAPGDTVGAPPTATLTTPANSATSGVASGSFGAAAGGSGAIVPTPSGNGRKTIQGANLQLSTSGRRIDAVSQELFNVVAFNNGIVKGSQITAAGSSSYANFQLSIPSGNLAQAMTSLSTMRYAHVVARTDATQDVNGQYNATVARLADAKALHTALLKQLAAATTETQITSLQAQIKDAEATISAAQAALGSLEHRINYSAVQVQINSQPIVPVVSTSGSSHGFTLGTAWHDAIRVLTVVAGISLIALAVLIPLGLLAAVIVWIAYWIRRRRREAALDAA
jgi:Domain of unknown function (DUF4349)